MQSMMPVVKRCAETRAHNAHEWYNPLRVQCPGGPDEGDLADRLRAAEADLATARRSRDALQKVAAYNSERAHRAETAETENERLRAALGVETPSAVIYYERDRADQAEADLAAERAKHEALRAGLAEALGWFVHSTHPGQPCKQSGHIPVEMLDRLTALLDAEAGDGDE